jgi:hypothetical protein
MPTAETPFEQAGELALATKWTGELDVLPLEGELTDTPAIAGSAELAYRHTATKSFPTFILRSPASSLENSPRGAAKLLRILGRVLLTFKNNQQAQSIISAYFLVSVG